MRGFIVIAAALALSSCECSSPLPMREDAEVRADAPRRDTGERDTPAPFDAGEVDGYPTGAISFFASACPTGWEPYETGAGRIVVGAGSAGAGDFAGTPLESGEDREHSHTGTVTLSPTDVGFAGATGCCHDGLTPSTPIETALTVEPASSGLPYIQLLTCIKRAAPGPVEVPAHAVAWFAANACPAGWSQPPSMTDRFPVAAPSGAANELSFGSSVGVGTHVHTASGTVELPADGVALAGGGSGFGGSGDAPYTTAIVAAELELPTIRLRACARD